MTLIKRIDKGPYNDLAAALTGPEYDGNIEHLIAEIAAAAVADPTGATVPTNLSYDALNQTLGSSTGNSVYIPNASLTLSGFMSALDKALMSGTYPVMSGGPNFDNLVESGQAYQRDGTSGAVINAPSTDFGTLFIEAVRASNRIAQLYITTGATTLVQVYRRNLNAGGWTAWRRGLHTDDLSGLNAAIAGRAAADHSHAAATSGTSGFMTGADRDKLTSIASGATANASDAALRARGQHTGFMLVAAIDPAGASLGQVPRFDGTIVAWADPPAGTGTGGGTGNVTGPASSVDLRLAVFSGLTGKIVADGGQTINDLLTTVNSGLAGKAPIGNYVEQNAAPTQDGQIPVSLNGKASWATPVPGDPNATVAQIIMGDAAGGDVTAETLLATQQWAVLTASAGQVTPTLAVGLRQSVTLAAAAQVQVPAGLTNQKITLRVIQGTGGNFALTFATAYLKVAHPTTLTTVAGTWHDFELAKGHDGVPEARYIRQTDAASGGTTIAATTAVKYVTGVVTNEYVAPATLIAANGWGTLANSAGTLSFSFSSIANAFNQSHTATTAVTLTVPAGFTNQSGIIAIKQDATGGRPISYSGWTLEGFPTTVPTTANATTYFTYFKGPSGVATLRYGGTF